MTIADVQMMTADTTTGATTTVVIAPDTTTDRDTMTDLGTTTELVVEAVMMVEDPLLSTGKFQHLTRQYRQISLYHRRGRGIYPLVGRWTEQGPFI